MKRLLAGAAGLGLLLWAGMASTPDRADAQNGHLPDARFAGLQWTFARIRYTAWTVPSGGYLNPEDEPWFIDAPAAEQNLSRRVRTATAIQVNDPVVLTIEDPNLFSYPWIYIVEPGNLRLKDAEVPILREFLLRGGTLTFDDFHGPFEWELTEKQLKRVFPDREIVEIAPPHPIYNCFYRIDKYPPDSGPGLVPERPHLGEGRLHRPPARHHGRLRTPDGADQLEHRHGRRRRVVERRRIPGLHQVDGAGLPDAHQRSDLLAHALRIHESHDGCGC
jgi:hypothetical protein